MLLADQSALGQSLKLRQSKRSSDSPPACRSSDAREGREGDRGPRPVPDRAVSRPENGRGDIRIIARH